ncbi:hypothetical protein [Ktedonobacter sp. SOSP1-52]|uniref:hypothetical protein n=1 Tax=Ktedonobacter sp. SOSP1-52 TaxID=2778366 RepID=UPI001F2FBB56|nr:hypothetical protein [Ktedonobacter sp. SOSP1-52]
MRKTSEYSKDQGFEAKVPLLKPQMKIQQRWSRFISGPGSAVVLVCSLLAVVGMVIFYPIWATALSHLRLPSVPQETKKASPPFDPALGAVLPRHRVVAYYAVPGSEVTGPAFEPSESMYEKLRGQGAAYERLDPAHPVQSGVDLVVSVPDSFPGPDGYYSHHVDARTIQSYVDFCQRHHLLLFLDLNFGRAPVMKELTSFLPYLQRYSFVHLAVDPEWMFPRHDGVPGVNLSNVRASDLNPIIEALATIPMKYHVPRKMLIFHQYRGDGDSLTNPFDATQAELADKHKLLADKRVDVILHVDSVGGYQGDHEDKKKQYAEWVGQDMKQYHNFLYGGFKLFYHIEAATGLMTPADVLAMKPAPLVITYGN